MSKSVERRLAHMGKVAKVGTCKDCKWWEGSCFENEIVRVCKKVDEFEEFEYVMRDYFCGTYYNDYSGREELSHNCVTGPDFGCIHWEIKDDQ